MLIRSSKYNPTIAHFSIADASDNKLLFISPSGNVGIGLTNPQAALHVSGSMLISGNSIGLAGEGNILYRDLYATVLDSPSSTAYMSFKINNTDRVIIKSDGNVGIGVTNPIAKLHVENTIIAPPLFAQWSLSGGGIVTHTSTHIKWSKRILALPIDLSYGALGYFDITCPLTGTIEAFTGTSGVTTVTCTSDGIPMSSYQALFYKVNYGQNEISVQEQFVIVMYNNTTYKQTSDWILLAIRNADDNYIKWLPANTYLPRNTIFYPNNEIIYTSPQAIQDSGFTGDGYFLIQGPGQSKPIEMFVRCNYIESKPWVLGFASNYASSFTTNLVGYSIPWKGIAVQRNDTAFQQTAYFTSNQVFNSRNTSGTSTSGTRAGYYVYIGYAGGMGIYSTAQSVCSWSTTNGAVGAGWDGVNCGSWPNGLLWGTGDGATAYVNRGGAFEVLIWWD